MEQPAIALHVGMKQRRLRRDCFQRIEQRRHLLVLDIDKLDSLFSDCLALRRDSRDFLADKPDHPVGEDRHVVDFSADQKPVDVFSRNNRMHPG